MKPIKKTIACILVLLFILSFALPGGVFAFEAAPDGSGYRTSGLTSMSKLSKEEISALLASNPLEMPSELTEIFDEIPHCSAPYSPGAVNAELLERTLSRLNALRRIAGLQPVSLDSGLCENAQYGAVLLSASNFSHHPDQPSDMDDPFYQLGHEATSSSNIFAGMKLLYTPDAFMDDSRAGNLPRVGHRRWQLNPAMGKIGFGYAVNENAYYQRYTCEKVFDQSAPTGNYDFISWPASGFFPNNTVGFTMYTPWSITLDPNKYSVPQISDLTVTVVRESDGSEWVLSGSQNYTASDTGAYLNVDTQYCGVPLCIIFRPENSEVYEGLYTVRVDGLKNKNGQSVDFAYQVDFFSTFVAGPDEALNYPGQHLSFITGADYSFVERTVSGRTVGVSGSQEVDDSVSYVSTTISCNAGDTLSFDYYLSTAPDVNWYLFEVDGVAVQRLSGWQRTWKSFTYTVETSGTHTFRWRIIKYHNYIGDEIMLDNVRYTANASLPGDADGNGVVDTADALLVLRCSLGLAGDAAQLLMNCDMDGNDSLDTTDALMILRLALGLL